MSLRIIFVPVCLSSSLFVFRVPYMAIALFLWTICSFLGEKPGGWARTDRFGYDLPGGYRLLSGSGWQAVLSQVNLWIFFYR